MTIYAFLKMWVQLPYSISLAIHKFYETDKRIQKLRSNITESINKLGLGVF